MPAQTFKLILAVALFFLNTSIYASEIKTDKQKLSYAFGYQIGNKLKESFAADNIELDPAVFTMAIKDILEGNTTKITTSEMQAAVQKYAMAVQQKKQQSASKNLKAGQDFLEKNKSKKGVVSLPSGLQYKVIKNGTGKKPTKTSSVTVHYRGTLLNGQVFDSSYERGAPTSLQLTNVIQGWQEAMQLMNEGSKWELYIPGKLAYGQNGAGKIIGPNETLIFEVELIKVN